VTVPESLKNGIEAVDDLTEAPVFDHADLALRGDGEIVAHPLPSTWAGSDTSFS